MVGIDNDMRSRFFGAEASTRRTRDELCARRSATTSITISISGMRAASLIFSSSIGADIAAVVHTAAQPSHDWAARDPQTDFTVNANGTLNLLEAAREFARKRRSSSPRRTKSTATRRTGCRCASCRCAGKSSPDHEYEPGISETMSIDHTKHSLFGASKVAADVLVQEYGRYFGMPTACFRGGCLTGPAHAGTELHGFLSYLMNCTVTGAALSRLRLQGQTGARQHSQLRPGGRVCRVHSAPRESGRFTTSAAAATATARCSKRSSSARKSAAASSPGTTKKTTGSATTSGGSAMCGNFRSIIRTGNFATGCARFSKKFTRRSQGNFPRRDVLGTSCSMPCLALKRGRAEARPSERGFSPRFAERNVYINIARLRRRQLTAPDPEWPRR